jgi:hypothetical protein
VGYGRNVRVRDNRGHATRTEHIGVSESCVSAIPWPGIDFPQDHPSLASVGLPVMLGKLSELAMPRGNFNQFDVWYKSVPGQTVPSALCW